MFTKISQSNFDNAFRGSQYENNFTYKGKEALFDYLEEYEKSTGEEIKLDICAIACDFSEYDSALWACKDRSSQEYEDEDEARAYLEYNTTVIDVEGGGVIIQAF